MKRHVRYNDDENGEIKKGPWKVEEDEVLINHVRKYGPRDWSYIRSKGSLQRTGKSCRLRWVNKLQPNLKSGVKFSAEEERSVIELQGVFGNKWAKIATYLCGRTDNDVLETDRIYVIDELLYSSIYYHFRSEKKGVTGIRICCSGRSEGVKNFWSSRQKRLNRILQNSGPSSSRPHRATKDVQPDFHVVPFMEGSKFSSSTKEESRTKSQSRSSSHLGDLETLKMMPLPDLLCPTFMDYEQSTIPLNYSLPNKKPLMDPQLHLSFPQILQLQTDFPMPPFGDPNFFDVFGNSTGSVLGTSQIPLMPSYFGPDRSCQVSGTREVHETVIRDTFIDDFLAFECLKSS